MEKTIRAGQIHHHHRSSSSSAASENRDSDGEDNQSRTVDEQEYILSSNAADEGSSSYCIRLVKIYCMQDPLLHLTLRNDGLILAPADPSDPFQWWYKDERHARVKDEDGFPSFAIVNKSTGQAMSSSIRKSIHMLPYNPNAVEKHLLWTEGNDMGNGYRMVRTTSKVNVCLNAYGGANMGTEVGLYERWCGDPNEIWRITTMKKFVGKLTTPD